MGYGRKVIRSGAFSLLERTLLADIYFEVCFPFRFPPSLTYLKSRTGAGPKMVTFSADGGRHQFLAASRLKCRFVFTNRGSIVNAKLRLEAVLDSHPTSVKRRRCGIKDTLRWSAVNSSNSTYSPLMIRIYNSD